MANRIFLWRHVAAIGTISLLAACAQTPAASVASNPPPIQPGANATWYHIEFMTGSHSLGPQGKLTVADVTTMMKHNPNAIATIIGATDTVGSPNYNMHLSHMRADTVRDELVYHSKVAADRIETRWTGETRQRVASANNVSMDVNRVVDIAVH